MRRFIHRFLFISLLFAAPRFVFASAVINEVLFDPSGTDTGLEEIEIYNPDSASQDLSSWELYPDGVGYFTFPNGFSLGPKSSVVIHLRQNGTNDGANLYHSAATSNMGNSSGSLTLFRSGGRSKDTIADFLRYQKPGAAERKTWESTAVDAGLWVAGTFVDVSGFSEGNSIGLTKDGQRRDSASWKIYASPTLGSANASLNEVSSLPSSSSPPPSSATATPPSVPAPPTPPSLRVFAIGDPHVFAGAPVAFSSLAQGLNGEPLENARFLWNFGDGSTAEGKSRSHIFYFPGRYVVNVSASAGEYTGSGYLAVEVLEPDIFFTEIQAGPNGFVELFNHTPETLDVGGLTFVDSRGTEFRIPPHNLVEKGGAVVLANALTRLEPLPHLIMRDGRGVILDEVSFSYPVAASSSVARFGDKFQVSDTPTPGTYQFLLTSAPQKEKHIGSAITLLPRVLSESPASSSAAIKTLGLPSLSVSSASTSTAAASSGVSPSSKLFFILSIVMAAIAAGSFFLVKRLPQS